MDAVYRDVLTVERIEPAGAAHYRVITGVEAGVRTSRHVLDDVVVRA